MLQIVRIFFRTDKYQVLNDKKPQYLFLKKIANMTYEKQKLHTFHIPVMGLAYTIDSPIKVAHYGISSVISIADDDLIEKMIAFYSSKFQQPYHEITQKMEDYRAKRITTYLNLVSDIVQKKFGSFKSELCENKAVLEQYINMLPSQSDVRAGLQNILEEGFEWKNKIADYVERHLTPGAIDVNIMTKLDKENFIKNETLPIQYNDAHAALRGFANSKLRSSIVLSAGMNPRLFSYFEEFSDFFPDENNQLRKKITLKVSDFRSAMIQGNFLAKKGLWVSEYRIESGLNCGGHAFATDGILLGPILEEFKQKKNELITANFDLMCKALQHKNLPVPSDAFPLEITVQGGVGTAAEHDFLLDNYKVDAVGWGSPFLLVPEATTLDAETRTLLAKAEEKDLYLSHISPLGVPFNTIRGTTNEFFKQQRIDKDKAGSSCPKKFLALSKGNDGKGICTASKKYQDVKIEELESIKDALSEKMYSKRKNAITEKACLCVGLANASYLYNDIKIKGEAQGVVICPGPNMAYFNQEISLAEMVNHIYGRANVMPFTNRPNLFIKEIELYVTYLKNEMEDENDFTKATLKKWNAFKTNLLSGIDYYEELFSKENTFDKREITNEKLQFWRTEIKAIAIPELEMV